MYSYINHEMRHASLDHGFLVSKPKGKSRFEYGQMAIAIQLAIITHQGKLSKDEYIVICQPSRCIRICKHFTSSNDARRYAKANGKKLYMNASTWQMRPVGIRRAILDLIAQ